MGLRLGDPISPYFQIDFFCEASQDQLTCRCWLMMWFETLSSFNANFEKK